MLWQEVRQKRKKSKGQGQGWEEGIVRHPLEREEGTSGPRDFTPDSLGVFHEEGKVSCMGS